VLESLTNSAKATTAITYKQRNPDDKDAVLLPGLDGTGNLFVDFVSALPRILSPSVVRYPPQQSLSYSQLLSFVEDQIPYEGHYVLVAESFSTPLAVSLAGARPPNLAGLVLCAGFVSCPFRKWKYLFKLLARPWVFRFQVPNIILERVLVGPSASSTLKQNIRQSLRLVNPGVLAGRVQEVLSVDVGKALSAVDVPILYLQAKNDRLVRPTCFEEIQRLQTNAILTSIPGPHLILQREPHQAANVIMEFINRLGDGKAHS